MAVAAPATAEPDEDTEEEDSDMSEVKVPDFEDLEGPLEEETDVAFDQLPRVEVPIPPRDQESSQLLLDGAGLLRCSGRVFCGPLCVSPAI